MEPPVIDAAEELLRTYAESGGINYIDAAALLPSRPSIESACVDLMSLMFPGFHGEPLVQSSDLPDVTRSRIK
ncbi:MAG: serine acetyltransferase, partial [Verrucomicrobiota bacterium]|nr:serine acetyltransferase [Verrucomicrobiota bacterium]